ncbi:MAG TPA: hypothetical protein VLC07_09240, partial [Solirubrobacterales bacterium]|nr:hypothetical protein [Solirubrobacterales bacterium]
LARPAPQRTFAIWFLRDEGFSPTTVVGAVRAAKRGYGRDVITGLLEAALLEGDAAEEVVAA